MPVDPRLSYYDAAEVIVHLEYSMQKLGAKPSKTYRKAMRHALEVFIATSLVDSEVLVPVPADLGSEEKVSESLARDREDEQFRLCGQKLLELLWNDCGLKGSFTASEVVDLGYRPPFIWTGEHEKAKRASRVATALRALGVGPSGVRGHEANLLWQQLNRLRLSQKLVFGESEYALDEPTPGRFQISVPFARFETDHE